MESLSAVFATTYITEIRCKREEIAPRLDSQSFFAFYYTL